MTERTFSVSELMTEIDRALGSALPGPVWVRGEITGLRRSSRGAGFFRLADAGGSDAALEVSARGRVMFDIEGRLDGAGLGKLRDGVEVRARGTVAVDQRQSRIRLSLLEIDPAFIAGRLAMEKAEILRRMAADGSLRANGLHELPLVPLRVGLVTSRGSAAHADFIDHLESSGFGFSVKTAHATVQGESAPAVIARAVERVAEEQIDVIALIRGGGSKLDLAAFDTEVVARAVAAAPVPVVTGIGHETDRTVADEAAAVYQKTPTAASEWLLARVEDFAGRLDRARAHIHLQARSSMDRSHNELAAMASTLRGTRGALARHHERLTDLSDGISAAATAALTTEHRRLDVLGEWFSTVDVDRTLRRGFALVTTEDGQVVRSVEELEPGQGALVRLSDGTVPVIVRPT